MSLRIELVAERAVAAVVADHHLVFQRSDLPRLDFHYQSRFVD